MSHDPFVAVYDLCDPRRRANPTEEEGGAPGANCSGRIAGAGGHASTAVGAASSFLSSGVDANADGSARAFAPGALLIASDGVWDNWKYEDVASALLRPAQILRVAQATQSAGKPLGGSVDKKGPRTASLGGGGGNDGGDTAGPLGGLTRSGSRARCGLPRQGANTDQWHAVGSGSALVPGAASRGGTAGSGGVGCPTDMANEFMDKNAELAKAHFGSQADNMTAVAMYILPL